MNHRKQLILIKNKSLYYGGSTELSDVIAEASTIHSYHQFPLSSEQNALLAGIFSIGSAISNFERVEKFMGIISQWDLEQLQDDKQVHAAACASGLPSVDKNRYVDITFISREDSSGVLGLIQSMHEDPVYMRRQVAKHVYGVADKTAAFIMYNTGYKGPVIVFDRHVTFQSQTKKFPLPERYIHGRPRANGKMVIDTIVGNRYYDFEDFILEKLSSVKNIPHDFTGIDYTSIAWTLGSKLYRNGTTLAKKIIELD